MTVESQYDLKNIATFQNVNKVDRDDITIIIPTLNEEKAIGSVIEDLYHEGYDKIIVIDGYSSDDTINVVRGYKVKLLQQHGKGKTGAIRTAIERVNTPYMVIIDGDCTYSARDIAKFLPHMMHYDEVIGARTIGRDNIKPLNRLGNWIINKLFNLLFSTKVSDICSGLYALRTDFAKDLVLNTEGFDVEVEIGSQAAIKGSITEVSIGYNERVGVQKLRPLHDGFKIFKTIINMARIHNTTILYSFLLSLFMIPAFLLLGWVAIEWFSGTWHSGLALGGILLMILTSQSLILNISLSQQKRMKQQLLHKINNK